MARCRLASGLRAVHPVSAELANLPLFERYAGRVLSVAEKETVATLEDLSTAHREITATLARQERTVAFLYLRRIVPSAEAEACNDLIQRLTGQSDARGSCDGEA